MRKQQVFINLFHFEVVLTRISFRIHGHIDILNGTILQLSFFLAFTLQDWPEIFFYF